MTRKLFPVLTVLIALSMLLAACGGGAPAGEEPAAAVEEPAEAAAEPGDTEGPAPAASQSGYGETLATVKERGKVICGGNASVPGFGYLDTEGNYAGFDIEISVDFDRVAAAVARDFAVSKRQSTVGG